MANSVIKHIQVGPSGTAYDIVNQKVKVGTTTFDDNAVVSITGSNGVSVVGATGTNPTITVKGPSNYVIGGSQTTTSSADGGSNVFTFNKSDGTSATFTVKNGSKGSTGAVGPTGPTGPAPDLTKYPTLSGTNTFTGSNWFKGNSALITTQNGIRIGFSNGLSPDADGSIYSIDKYGFYGLGKDGSLQTIKFPDLSTFSTATHTIPLSDTDNTFTGTNTFTFDETETTGSLYRTLINKSGVSAGAGPKSGVIAETTYGYNNIKQRNLDTTYTYSFPNKSGKIALTDDCITIIERTGITLPTKAASTAIALTDEEKALIVKDPSKVMFRINLSNVFYFSGAHGPTYRYDPVYPRSDNSYYIQMDQQTGSPCTMFMTLQGVVTSNPGLSGSETALTSISINGTPYKIGDVTAAGNNTFTGDNTFNKHISLQFGPEGYIDLGNNWKLFGSYLNNGTGTSLSFPSGKNGTIALTSDIPDTSNFVTLSGAQTISGNKTFNNHIILPNGPDGYIEFGSWRFFGYSLSNNVTKTSLSFPSGKNGTIATTNDIPIKTATLSGTTLRITLS